MLTILCEMFIWAFYLHYRADFFTGDVTNSGLHGVFLLFDSWCCRLVTGLVLLLKTQPMYIFICIRTHYTGSSFEPIFMKFT